MTVFVFGCTTVRVPVSGLAPDVGPIRGTIAEPQVELWLESADPVRPDEAAAASEATRAALASALEGRGEDDAAADAVLLVRERAVARTSSRRSAQGWAVAGIVVGAVVVVAAVAIAIVAGAKPPRSSAKPATARVGPRPASSPAVAAPTGPRPAPSTVVPAPRAAPARGVIAPHPAPPRLAGPVPVAAPVRTAPRPPGAPRPYPAPSYGYPYSAAYPYPTAYPGFQVAFGVELAFPLPAPEPLVLAPPPPEPEEEEWDAEPAEEEPEPLVEATPPLLVAPPPQPFDVEERGFFSGDVVQLELTLLDRRSGQVLWSRVVRRDVDPRDPGAVEAIVEKALADQTWARRAPGRAPGPHP
jgi:hypothetical protein